MLNYVASDSLVQIAFLALLGAVILVVFIYRTRLTADTEEFKREIVRNEWRSEERREKQILIEQRKED
jgi:uncharacterized YccA/Bax inhibitor family protein